MRFALSAICATMLIGCHPLPAEYVFAIEPAGGVIFGQAGQTIGWGYTLTNLSSTDWLVPINLDAGLFSHSTPELFFGFPVLAPLTQVHVPFDLFTAQGLFAITWDPGAPLNATEQGEFLLQAEWWSDDPFAGGAYLDSATPTAVAYEARIGAPVPETSTSAMVVCASGLLVVLRLSSRLRFCKT